MDQRFVRLTNALDNPIWVNVYDITHVELEEMGTGVNKFFGLRVYIRSGLSVLVQECWRDLSEAIKSGPPA